MTVDYSKLPDGTPVRFKHLESTGWMYYTEIRDGKIVGPDGRLFTPSGLAATLDKTIRGEEGHDSWGPESWEAFTGDTWEFWETLEAP